MSASGGADANHSLQSAYGLVVTTPRHSLRTQSTYGRRSEARSAQYTPPLETTTSKMLFRWETNPEARSTFSPCADNRPKARTRTRQQAPYSRSLPGDCLQTPLHSVFSVFFSLSSTSSCVY